MKNLGLASEDAQEAKRDLFSTHDEEFFQKHGLGGMSQYLAKPNVSLAEAQALRKTLDLMLERRESEDPELVAFVKTLIHQPFPRDELNLKNTVKKDRDYSQIGQSKFIDGLLKSERNGFFVEAGAYDGESISNSLFFELSRNWTGLLVEVIRPLFEKVIAKQRHVYAINACLADRVQIGKIRATTVQSLSGLETELSRGEKLRAHREHVDGKLAGRIKADKSFEFVFTPCFSLVTILKAIDVRHVDYFSLDTEGNGIFILLIFLKVRLNWRVSWLTDVTLKGRVHLACFFYYFSSFNFFGFSLGEFKAVKESSTHFVNKKNVIKMFT